MVESGVFSRSAVALAVDKVTRALNLKSHWIKTLESVGTFSTDLMEEIQKYSTCISWKQKCYKEKKENKPKQTKLKWNKQGKTNTPKHPKQWQERIQTDKSSKSSVISSLAVHTKTGVWSSPSGGICQKVSTRKSSFST